LSVFVDSAFLRAAPLPDAEIVGSLVEGDRLEALGRNFDGMWFEVRRPGSNAVAWVANEVVTGSFDAWVVPITSTDGVEGPEPVLDTPLAVFILDNAALRDEPFLDGGQLALIPHSVTLPVIGRNQDASWLRVNYNGYLGWVSRSVTRVSGDPMSLPLGFELPPLSVAVIIIPPELQQAQVDRMREFAHAQFDLSEGLKDYWQGVAIGEIMPCTPPPFAPDYPVVPQDIQQLPEINRVLPQLSGAVNAINQSLEPLQDCGVYARETAYGARAAAINSRLMFLNVLNRLDQIEALIH